jgi:hypothetical protein
MSESRLLMMFIKGLIVPFRGWVKALKPVTLRDSIERTRDLVGATYKNKITPKPPIVTRGGETPDRLTRAKERWMKLQEES